MKASWFRCERVGIASYYLTISCISFKSLMIPSMQDLDLCLGYLNCYLGYVRSASPLCYVGYVLLDELLSILKLCAQSTLLLDCQPFLEAIYLGMCTFKEK